MIWIAFAAGWVAGSVSLYLYMVRTAKEPRDPDCVECHLPECGECPYRAQARDAVAAKRAA